MRIWDLEPTILCRKHLLGEHNELHIIWNCITQNKKGWSNHPETKRWVGKLKALYLRHDKLVEEMKTRGFNHKSDLDESLCKNSSGIQDVKLITTQQQLVVLKSKGCSCNC